MEKLEYLKNNDDNTPYIEEQALDPSIFSFNDFSSHYPLSQCYVNKKLHRYVHLLLEKLNLPLSMDTAIIKTYLRIKKSSSKTSINSMALLVSLVVLYSKFYNYPTSINEVIKIVRDFDPKIKKRHVLKYMFLIKSTNTVFNKILQPISFIDMIIGSVMNVNKNSIFLMSLLISIK
ncbi:MAG: hypothetical protein QXP88_03470 [Thermoproteota archaeon]